MDSNQVAAPTVFPPTFILSNSNGRAQYCAYTGRPMYAPLYVDAALTEGIMLVDMREYMDFWSLIDLDGISTEIDMVDTSFTTSTGASYSADIDFRVTQIIENRVGEKIESFIAIHDSAKTHFTVLVCDGWGNIEPFSVTLIGKSITGEQLQYLSVRFMRARHAIEAARYIALILGENNTTVEISLVAE